jgi:hypothetical protein
MSGNARNSAAGTMVDQPVAATAPQGRSRRRKALVAALALVVVVALAAGGSALAILGLVDRRLERFGDPFAELSEGPARSAANHGVNVLLLASDGRASAGDLPQ